MSLRPEYPIYAFFSYNRESSKRFPRNHSKVRDFSRSTQQSSCELQHIRLNGARAWKNHHAGACTGIISHTNYRGTRLMYLQLLPTELTAIMETGTRHPI